MSAHSLLLPFTARGRDGIVRVDVTANTHPAWVGSAEWATGFPICEASIDWEAKGYNALLGWIQMVGMRDPSSDGPRHWVTDPLEIYDDLNTPFSFYGLTPALFDAPARSDRTRPVDWYAESFLCHAVSSPMAREAHPVAAFSWGFILSEERITIIEPKVLAPDAWSRHLGLLESTYPSWDFART